jgi:hypothetical protein
MTSKELERAHSQRPFNPFTMHLSDGTFYDVPTPEFLAHRPGDRWCFVIEVRGDGHAIIDLAHIVKITFREPALAPDTGD